MSLVFWRTVNGYMYPSNLSAGTPAPTAAPGGGAGAYYPYVSQSAPPPTAGPLTPFTAGTASLPSALALAAAAAAGSPTAGTPTAGPKWVMPSYLSSQQMYMVGSRSHGLNGFLPKMNKPKTERVNKAVKCDICNLTLNSELQAQQHYNGKNHLKKMKQLGMPLPGEDEGKKVIQQYTSEANSEGNEDSSQGDAPDASQGSQSEETEGSIEDNTRAESPSSGSQSNQPPASPTGQTTQQLDQPQQQQQPQQPQQQQQQQQPQQHTQQEQSPQQADQPAEKLDPVSQAVYDNILGKLPRKRKMEIPCSVCDMIFNSEAQASQHFRGVKHAKRLKMAEDFKAPSKSNSDGESSPDVSSAEGGKSSSFYCHYCGVALNSTQQLEEHREGQLHKKMVERKGPGQGRRPSDEIPGCQPGLMHCKVCDISVPSPARMQQHMSSLDHQERSAGPPPMDDAPDSPASSSSSQHQC